MAPAQEPIWFQDPLILARQDLLTHIVPLPEMGLASQLNAVMRFAILYGLALAVFQRPAAALYVPLIAAGVTAAVFASDTHDNHTTEEKMAMLDLQQDPVTKGLRVQPTQANPYMNVLMSDYARFPNRPPAADLGVPQVSQNAETCWEHDLYRDQNDVFNRNTTSRQFFTMPNTTIPNDQEGFARWLYQRGPTCKEGSGDACNARVFNMFPSM